LEARSSDLQEQIEHLDQALAKLKTINDVTTFADWAIIYNGGLSPRDTTPYDIQKKCQEYQEESEYLDAIIRLREEERRSGPGRKPDEP
jgi:hypothetical protein